MSYQPPGGMPPPPPPPPPQPGYQPPGPPFPASGYGMQGYAYAPSSSRWMSLKGLSTALLVLLAVTGVVNLFATVTLFNRVSAVEDFRDGNGTLQDLRDADDAVSSAVGFMVLLMLALGVVWIIWQFRHSKNAQALRGKTGLGPTWAIAGWFIPFGSAVLPQLELMQSARASDPDAAPHQPTSASRVPPVLVAWWVALDIGLALFFIGRTTRPGDNELNAFDAIDRFVRADRLSAIACLVMAVAAVIAIVMVRTLTERQARAIAAGGAQGAPQGYGYQPAPMPPPTSSQQWQPPAPPAPPPSWPPPPPQ